MKISFSLIVVIIMGFKSDNCKSTVRFFWIRLRSYRTTLLRGGEIWEKNLGWFVEIYLLYCFMTYAYLQHQSYAFLVFFFLLFQGTKAVKGLALKLPRTNPISLCTEAFKNMTKLKLLQLAGVKLNGDFKYLSRDLRWMNWHGFPLRHTPVDCYQGNLVAIELEYSSLKLVWKKA